jgi:hypothetical protein
MKIIILSAVVVLSSATSYGFRDPTRCRTCNGPTVWETTIDKSGRHYYYKTNTNTSQWDEPYAICDQCEKARRLEEPENELQALIRKLGPRKLEEVRKYWQWDAARAERAKKTQTLEKWKRDCERANQTSTVAVEPATEEESSQDVKCAICLDDVKPEHEQRTPCCFTMMHRHCLKSHVETADAVTLDAFERGVVATSHICPMCRKNWDEDAPMIPEYYRNFVQTLVDAELSAEELAMQQDDSA